MTLLGAEVDDGWLLVEHDDVSKLRLQPSKARKQLLFKLPAAFNYRKLGGGIILLQMLLFSLHLCFLTGSQFEERFNAWLAGELISQMGV